MTADAVLARAADLTPLQIVEELDRHIIGQSKAKRSVAVALRNHYRRRRLPEELQAEITPKNILMIGPTGGRQDRDRPQAGPSGEGAVPEGRGHQVHRGGVRGP